MPMMMILMMGMMNMSMMITIRNRQDMETSSENSARNHPRLLSKTLEVLENIISQKRKTQTGRRKKTVKEKDSTEGGERTREGGERTREGGERTREEGGERTREGGERTRKGGERTRKGVERTREVHNVDKRSPRCLLWCLRKRVLHPAQCHSYC